MDDVAVPRLGHDADHRRVGLHQVAKRLVVVRLAVSPPGGPEGNQGGRVELQLRGGALEELVVLRIGAGPAPFDVGDAQEVELGRDPELVVDGEGDPLLLAAVTKGGVEDVYGGGEWVS
jgi:hypothetical protein